MKRRTFYVLGVALLVLVPAVAYGTASGVSSPRTSSYDPELGIAIIFDDGVTASSFSDAYLASEANETFTYVKDTLHANAVSLNIPFYVSSQTSNDPHSGAGTLSLPQLSLVTHIALRYGLKVQIRPYMSEIVFGAKTSTNSPWRGTIKPTNLALWFSNYWNLMKPMLIEGKKDGASSFVIGLELDSLINDLNYWSPIIHKAKSLFGGDIVYSGVSIYQTLPGTQWGWDDYTAIGAPASASVATVTSQFEANLRIATFPAALQSTRIEELGIGAVDGAYQAPYVFSYPSNPAYDRTIQTNWFTAACNALWTYHLEGLYYWGVGLEYFQPGQPATGYTGWDNTVAQNAISTCFQRTS